MKFHEEEMLDAIAFGHEAIKDQIKAQVALAEAVGKKEVRTYEEEDHDEALEKEIHDCTYQQYYDIAKKGLSKAERSEQFSEVKEASKLAFQMKSLEEKGELISNIQQCTEKSGS